MKQFYFFTVLALFLSCKDETTLAEVQIEATHITSNSFIVNGQIGNGSANDYNLMYSLNENDNYTIVDAYGRRDSLYGFFSNLESDTIYYAKMFFTSGKDTFYSNVLEIRTLEKYTFSDNRDNQTYEYVEIGDRTWMAENLNYSTPTSCYYENDSLNNHSFGKLYTWDEAQTACPSGWHLPTRADWNELEQFWRNNLKQTDNSSFAKALKSIDSNQWEEVKYGNNSTGFNGSGSGHYDSNFNSFSSLKRSAFYWTKDMDESTSNGIVLTYYGELDSFSLNTNLKASVRCILD